MGMLPTGAWLFSDPEPLGQPANKEIQALIQNFRFKAEDITSQNTIDVGGEGIKTTWSKASGVPVQARGEEKGMFPDRSSVFQVWQAKEYRTRDGTYFVKVAIDSRRCVHLRFRHPPPSGQKAALEGVLTNLPLDKPLEFFNANVRDDL